MSYQVLARKWRPQNFAELIGQDHVQRALINALDRDRLHHAYLFTGTRGVGKTTIARILARSLNCETGVTSTPCGECSSCLEISQGRFVDLIEVDAASRTKVEDTRDLLENVQYAPTKGRYKVYLIDEVHMLSNHSFNALLKTLEEPPPHVKFLLATTDPQKLPVTVLSRCLQFHLKRLTVEQIKLHLENILAQEAIESDSGSTLLIARAADGSVRDSLSLLDQAIAFGSGNLVETDVRTMLGAIDHQEIISLLEALVTGDSEALMIAINTLAEHALDFDQVLSDVLSGLHYIALIQMAPGALDNSLAHIDELKKLATQLSPEDVQLYYQIGLVGRRDLPIAPDPRLGFEMVMLRMIAFKPSELSGDFAPSTTTPLAVKKKPDLGDIKAQLAQSNQPKEQNSHDQGTTPAPPHTTATAPEPATEPANNNPATPSKKSSDSTNSNSASHWEQIVSTLELTGMARQLALNCALERFDASHYELLLRESQRHLLNDSRKNSVEKAVKLALGDNIRVSIKTSTASIPETPAQIKAQVQQERLDTAVEDINSDSAVQQLKDTFGATVQPGTISPIDQPD